MMRVQKNQIRQMLVKGQVVAGLVLEVGKQKTIIYNFGTGRLNTVPSHKPKARKVAKPSVVMPTVGNDISAIYGPDAIELPGTVCKNNCIWGNSGDVVESARTTLDKLLEQIM